MPRYESGMLRSCRALFDRADEGVRAYVGVVWSAQFYVGRTRPPSSTKVASGKGFPAIAK